MKLCVGLLVLCGAVCWAQSGNAPQSSPSTEPSSTPAVLTNLFRPIYPPLARQARIMGDVKLQIKLRADGSVESAEVISGHPMLKPAALNSVQKSTFMCEGCAGKKYTITYTFGFREDNECRIVQKRSMKCLNLWKCGPRFYKYGPPLVGQSQDRVIILADTQCIDTQAAGSASSP